MSQTTFYGSFRMRHIIVPTSYPSQTNPIWNLIYGTIKCPVRTFWNLEKYPSDYLLSESKYDIEWTVGFIYTGTKDQSIPKVGYFLARAVGIRTLYEDLRRIGFSLI